MENQDDKLTEVNDNGQTPEDNILEAEIIEEIPASRKGSHKSSHKTEQTTSQGTPEANFPSTQPPLWIDIMAIVGVFLALQVVFGLLAMILTKTGSTSTGFSMFLAYTLSLVLTIGFAVAQRRRRQDEKPILKFSLKKTNPTLILWGIILVFITSIVLEPLLNLFPQEYFDLMDKSAGTGAWALVTVVICAPILEEILFRGVIQESVTRHYGGLRGVLVAAALFGIIHLNPPQVVNAFFMGIILGYIYLRTRSITPVILIHAVNNGLSFLLLSLMGSTSFSVDQLIGNATLYWIVYAACAVVFVIACFNVYSQLRKVKGTKELERARWS